MKERLTLIMMYYLEIRLIFSIFAIDAIDFIHFSDCFETR